MNKIEIYFAKCLSTNANVEISKAVFDDLVDYGFEASCEPHLNIYKDGYASLHEIYIVKMPFVHLYDVAHDEYELEA